MDVDLIERAVRRYQWVKRTEKMLANSNKQLQELLDQMTTAEFEEWKAATV